MIRHRGYFRNPSSTSKGRPAQSRWDRPCSAPPSDRPTFPILPCIAINRRPIDQPQWVGLDVPPRRRIVVAHPVLIKPRFHLEPLAGEAQVDRRAGHHMDAPERLVARRPHHRPGARLSQTPVGRYDRCGRNRPARPRSPPAAGRPARHIPGSARRSLRRIRRCAGRRR